MVLWDSIVGSLLGKVAPAVADYYKTRLELKHKLKLTKIEAEIAIEQAKVNMAAAEQQHNFNWELLSIQNSGWRDDGLTIFTVVILACTFLPWTQEYVAIGFDVLTEQTPVWFQAIVGVVYGSAFGVRVFTNFKNLVKR
jgi:hypothetical protein